MRTVIKKLSIIGLILFAGMIMNNNGAVQAQDAVSGATPNGTKLVEISTAEELEELSLNYGSEAYPKNGIYSLKANIDMTGKTFKMLGTSNDVSSKFSGIFAGNNFKISNLTITSTTSEIAMFATLNENAIVEDIIFVNPIVEKVGSEAGVVAVDSYGMIKNCSVLGGHISGGGNVGGIVADQKGNSITGTYVDGNTVILGTGSNIGGIAGSTSGYSGNATISQCYSYATITSSNTFASTFIGGIVGTLEGTDIINCYSAGTITAGGRGIGGIAGGCSYGSGSIRNTYSTATIQSTGSYAGGIIGRIQTSITGLENNVAINKSIKTTEYAGKIYGGKGGWDVDIASNIAWDEITFNEKQPTVDVTSRLSTELHSKSTFEGLGWDFENVWEWIDTRPGSYPVLRGLEGQSYTYPYERKEIAHTVTANPLHTGESWTSNPEITIDFESETPITEKAYMITDSEMLRKDSWIPIEDEANSMTINLSSIGSGSYYVHWKAIKQFGEIGSADTPFGVYKFDIDGPEKLKFTSTSKAIKDGTFTVTVQGEDMHSGVAKYAFVKDGETVEDSSWQEEGIYTYLGLEKDKKYRIKVYAMDQVGNVSEALTYDVFTKSEEKDVAKSEEEPDPKEDTDNSKSKEESTKGNKKVASNKNKQIPQTGDTTSIMLYIPMGAGLLLVIRKK